MGLVMAAVFNRDQMVLLVAGYIVGMRHAAGDVDFAGDWIDQFRSRLMDPVSILPKLFPFRSVRVSEGGRTSLVLQWRLHILSLMFAWVISAFAAPGVTTE